MSLNLAPLRELARRLPQGARVLDAHSTDPTLSSLLSAMGMQVTSNHKDLRLAQFGTTEWDGIWCPTIFGELPKEHCQRVLGTFFRALKPGALLMITLAGGTYSEADFSSLLRQMGFELVAVGETKSDSASEVAYLARRISTETTMVFGNA